MNLQNLTTLLNAKRDTPNRYQLIAAFGDPSRVALVKFVGKRTENVSGWLSLPELNAFLSGWIEGWDTHARSKES